MSEHTVRQIVTLNEARELARRAGKSYWRKYIPADCRDCLSEHYLEAEHCWFFFRNPSIVVPEEDHLVRSYAAYAVSKQGDVRSIADLSSDPEKLTDYLNLFSAYFAHREHGGPKPVLPDWMR
jgi:hypothetical protein